MTKRSYTADNSPVKPLQGRCEPDEKPYNSPEVLSMLASAPIAGARRRGRIARSLVNRVAPLVGLGLGAHLTLAATGCGSDVVARVDELSRAACACQDRPCAEQVNAQIGEFLETVGELSGNERDQLLTALQSAGTCLKGYL